MRRIRFVKVSGKSAHNADRMGILVFRSRRVLLELLLSEFLTFIKDSEKLNPSNWHRWFLKEAPRQ